MSVSFTGPILAERLSSLLSGLSPIQKYSPFIAVVMNLFLGMSTRVVGTSMEPALYNGQAVFINRFLYLISTPKRGDVVDKK